MWKELKLDKNPLLAKHAGFTKKVRTMVYKYRQVFSEVGSGCPGETDLVEMDLKLKPGTQPIRQKLRDLNPRMEANLQEQVDDWLEQGVIEPSESPWSSPLVPVRKKDGSTRWAVDFWKLNCQIIQDSYPLPKIQQLLDRAGGHQVYSTLDATSAYFCIRMDKSSK